MKSQLISIIMILSSLFSYSQKPEYEIIYPAAKFFEFNDDKDKIYIYGNDNKLSVYDVNKGRLSILDTGIVAETIRLRFPFFLTKTALVYFVNNESIYQIEDETIIKKVPFVYQEYQYGAIDDEWRKNEEQKMKVFNQLLSDYMDNDIQNLNDDIIILNYKDGNSIAFYTKRLKDGMLTEENKTKILKYAKPIDLFIDTTYMCKATNGGATNYFNNNKLIIKEKSYSCSKPHFMSLTSECKYEINIEFNNKTIKLKDNKRRSRHSIIGGESIQVDLNKYLPNSKNIIDKNGDIYLLFWDKEVQNLIKLPVNQFH